MWMWLWRRARRRRGTLASCLGKSGTALRRTCKGHTCTRVGEGVGSPPGLRVAWPPTCDVVAVCVRVRGRLHTNVACARVGAGQSSTYVWHRGSSSLAHNSLVDASLLTSEGLVVRGVGHVLHDNWQLPSMYARSRGVSHSPLEANNGHWAFLSAHAESASVWTGRDCSTRATGQA